MQQSENELQQFPYVILLSLTCRFCWCRRLDRSFFRLFLVKKIVTRLYTRLIENLLILEVQSPHRLSLLKFSLVRNELVFSAF